MRIVARVALLTLCLAGPGLRWGPAAQAAPPDPMGADPAGADPAGADPAGADPAGADPAAAVQVEGTVVRRGRVRPVAGLPLRVESAAGATVAETATDAAGRFTLQLAPGRYTVRIDDGALLPFESALEVSPGAPPAPVVLRVTPRLGVAADAQVVGERGGPERSLSLDRVEASQVAGTLGDPLRVIQSLPGVGSMSALLPYPVVRGAAPGDTAYLVDGTALPMLFHVGIGQSVIHPRLVDRVDFYPGVAPIRYGRYTGGAVEAITRPPGEEQTAGEHTASEHTGAEAKADQQTVTDLDLNLLQAGALVSVPFNDGDTRVTAAGRYSYTGLLLSQLAADTVLDFWDYHLRLDQRLPGDGHRLKLAVFGAENRFGYRGRTTDAGFHRVTAQHQVALGPDDRLLTQLDLGRDRVNSPEERTYYFRDPNCTPTTCQGGYLGDDYTTETRVEQQLIAEWMLRGRVEWDHWFADTLRLVTGLDYEARRAADDFDANQNDALVGFAGGQRARHALGLYAGLTWSPTPALRLTPGLRTDVYARDGLTAGVDPRLGAELTLNPDTTVRAQAGLSHAPQRFFLPVPGLSEMELDVDLVRAWQGAVGVSQRLGEAWSLDATVYGTVQRNLLLLDDGGYLSGGELPFDVSVEERSPRPWQGEADFTDGRGLGLEVLLRRARRGRWFGWLAATFQRHERRRADGTWAASPLDQTLVLNAVSTWQLTPGWSAGFRLHHHTGRPAAGSAGQNDPSAYDPARAISGRLPAYYQLDLRMDWIWIHDGMVIDLYVDVINATYNREVTAIGADGPRGNQYILPTLGLHLTF